MGRSFSRRRTCVLPSTHAGPAKQQLLEQHPLPIHLCSMLEEVQRQKKLERCCGITLVDDKLFSVYILWLNFSWCVSHWTELCNFKVFAWCEICSDLDFKLPLVRWLLLLVLPSAICSAPLFVQSNMVALALWPTWLAVAISETLRKVWFADYHSVLVFLLFQFDNSFYVIIELILMRFISDLIFKFVALMANRPFLSPCRVNGCLSQRVVSEWTI